VILVAHGSRDPRAASSTASLVRAVAVAHPGWEVHAAYLDHAGPRPVDVLSRLAAAGHRHAVVVPLLLTAAYHGKVDVPAVVGQARDAGLGIRVSITEVLGPSSDLLLDALVQRLGDASSLDAVVLAAAGTRDAAARETVAAAAADLGARLGVPSAVAYSSAAPPMAGDAVRSLGAARVGVAAYFLAPGRLYDIAVESALAAGAVVVAPPLGAASELVALVSSRVDATVGQYAAAA
jgi:sirohydrochlorin ferrochelatase